MAVLKVTNFGGEIPRVSPRALPADASQRNQNLLATSVEFRPLQGDTDIGAAPAGSKSLYRLPRKLDGSLRTSDSDGWIADTADKSYVAGQLNDDATSRTSVAWNDGTQPPRVIDAKGANRLLGVPAPAKPTVTLVETSQFTREQASAWVLDTLIPAISEALKAALYEDETGSRYYNSLPVAGPHSMYEAAHDTETLWHVFYSMPLAEAADLGFTTPDLGGKAVGGNWRTYIETLPYWGAVRDRAPLEAAIRLIENPRDGSQVFSDARITKIVDDLAAEFDPDGDSLKAMRAEIEKEAKDFRDAYKGIPPELPPVPVKPIKPTTPEFIDDGGFA